MRYGELLFVGLLVLYHAAVLFPRIRRPLALNFLLWLAGGALVWCLAREGWRWQLLPGVALWSLDALWLLFSLKSLRGRVPLRGWASRWKSFGRAIVAWVTFVGSIATLGLVVLFPLPVIPLTGGLTPGFRQISYPAEQGRAGLVLELWYPAVAHGESARWPLGSPSVWADLHRQGSPDTFWLSMWSRLPSSLVPGDTVASPTVKYPVIFVVLPDDQLPEEYGALWADLASRGFLVVASREQRQTESWAWPQTLPPWAQWLEPEAHRERHTAAADLSRLGWMHRQLETLNKSAGDPLEGAVDEDRIGLEVVGAAPTQPPFPVQATLFWGSTRSVADVRWGLQLWVHGPAPDAGDRGYWNLTVGRWHPADLTDAAYFKPYLTAFHLVSDWGGRTNAIYRQYQAAFFQQAFWGNPGTSFRAMVPELPGFMLSGS